MKSFTSPFQIPIFKKFIDDIAITISIASKTLYPPNQVMEKQLDNDNSEAHKAYIKLMYQ